MKFQRENTKVALTQQMKDEVVAKKEAQEAHKKEIIQKNIEQKKIIAEAEKNFAANGASIMQREIAYGPIQYQLDLLWHDMDRGVISVDKTAANTWYAHIKAAKEAAPLANNWHLLYNKSYHEMKVAIANTNNDSV